MSEKLNILALLNRLKEFLKKAEKIRNYIKRLWVNKMTKEEIDRIQKEIIECDKIRDKALAIIEQSIIKKKEETKKLYPEVKAEILKEKPKNRQVELSLEISNIHRSMTDLFNNCDLVNAVTIIAEPPQKKIFISSKMTGLPGYNYDAFKEMEKALTEQEDCIVLNPAKIGLKYGYNEPYDFYIRKSLQMLLEADEVLFFGDYQNSKGSQIEKKVAELVGIPIVIYKDFKKGLDKV